MRYRLTFPFLKIGGLSIGRRTELFTFNRRAKQWQGTRGTVAYHAASLRAVAGATVERIPARGMGR